MRNFEHIALVTFMELFNYTLIVSELSYRGCSRNYNGKKNKEEMTGKSRNKKVSPFFLHRKFSNSFLKEHHDSRSAAVIGQVGGYKCN